MQTKELCDCGCYNKIEIFGCIDAWDCWNCGQYNWLNEDSRELYAITNEISLEQADKDLQQGVPLFSNGFYE